MSFYGGMQLECCKNYDHGSPPMLREGHHDLNESDSQIKFDDCGIVQKKGWKMMKR